MQRNDIPMVIDAPNFVNRILEMSIDKGMLSEKLSLEAFKELVNQKLVDSQIPFYCDIVEFVCSLKLFGSADKGTQFTKKEREFMVKRFKGEKGVHVEEVAIPSSSKKEKGVDIMVATKISAFAENFKGMVLVAEDKDYIPLLQQMRRQGILIILVAFKETFPIELINESYKTIDISPVEVNELLNPSFSPVFEGAGHRVFTNPPKR